MNYIDLTTLLLKICRCFRATGSELIKIADVAKEGFVDHELKTGNACGHAYGRARAYGG